MLLQITVSSPLPVLQQMILQKEFHVIYALAHVCGQDRTLLASLLLRIFRHEKAEAPLLRTLNDREINMEGRTESTRRTRGSFTGFFCLWVTCAYYSIR